MAASASSLFSSDRLTYRAYRTADLDNLHALWNDPVVQVGSRDDFIVPRPDSFRDVIARWGNDTPLFSIVEETDSGAFVGQTSLRWEGFPVNRDAHVGIAIHRAFRGRGYGKEIMRWTVQHGFRTMGLHRISLGVFESNVSAIALYKSVGFAQEGVKRKAHWFNGKWEDLIWMGLVEDDFWTRQQAK
ncbi:acyl-CoA N-acyltransferase [Amylostereum chailletii]|nr:acyl-CoA N-acyltransferase [Amylostereum chailletii]